MKRLTSALIALATLGFAGVASATDYDSVTFANIQPVQTTDYTLGTLNTHVFTVGGYNLGRIKVSGTLEEINGTTGDFGSENRIRVKYPDGRFKDVQLTTTTGYTGPLAFNTAFFLAFGEAAPYGGGTWEFYYINTLDDAPTGGVADAQCTVTFTLSDEQPTPPASFTDLGTLNNSGQTDPTPSLINTTAHAAGDVKWFKIVVPEAVTGTKYLDIDTEDTVNFLAGNDTEIGIYDMFGTLVVSDDDDGSSLLSQLSFGLGAGSRPALTTGTNTVSAARNGRDGDLAAGTYYVAVAGFNAAFANNFTVTTTSTRVGDVVLNFRTNVVGSVPQVISGTADLVDRTAGSEVGEQVTVEIRNVGDTSPLHTAVVTLGSGGTYSFSIASPLAAGNYDVALKHAKHLRKVVGSVAIATTGASDVNASLTNGDCNDDNEVGIGDFALISSSYNTSDGDPGYDARADLTGDASVDIADYAVLSANFGLFGDD